MCEKNVKKAHLNACLSTPAQSRARRRRRRARARAVARRCRSRRTPSMRGDNRNCPTRARTEKTLRAAPDARPHRHPRPIAERASLRGILLRGIIRASSSSSCERSPRVKGGTEDLSQPGAAGKSKARAQEASQKKVATSQKSKARPLRAPQKKVATSQKSKKAKLQGCRRPKERSPPSGKA